MTQNTQLWVTTIAATVGPLIGVAIGLFAGYFFELKRETRAIERLRVERAEQFQREKLLEVMREVGNYTQRNYELHDAWMNDRPIRPEAQAEVLLTAGRLHSLAALIRDKEAYRMIIELVDQQKAVTAATTSAEASTLFLRMTAPLDRLHIRIANLILQIDDPKWVPREGVSKQLEELNRQIEALNQSLLRPPE